MDCELFDVSFTESIDWEDKVRAKLKELADSIDEEQLAQRAISVITNRISQARDMALGQSSHVAELHSQIRSQTQELDRQQAYFAERVADGEGEIAQRALEEIERARKKLEVHEESLKRKEGMLSKAFAACEARLPRITIMLTDKKMIEKLQDTVGSIQGIGEKVERLIPDTLEQLAIEFGRIDHMLEFSSEKAMALPMPDLSGDDIQSVMARVVSDETVFAQELETLESELFSEPNGILA